MTFNEKFDWAIEKGLIQKGTPPAVFRVFYELGAESKLNPLPDDLNDATVLHALNVFKKSKDINQAAVRMGISRRSVGRYVATAKELLNANKVKEQERMVSRSLTLCGLKST